jgi:hypothetical protein
MLSINDQSHGHIINPEKETPVITMIATGNICNLMTGEFRSSSGSYGKFINPYSITEIGNFCKIFKLPCDTGIIIEGEDSIRTFITEVQKQRDFMTDTLFESIIKNPDGTSKIAGVTLNSGLISHTEVVGDALEGLVLMLEYANGTRDTKKYKFPIYTIRTMLIRELFGKSGKDNMTLDKFVRIDKGQAFIQEYMNKWVGTSGKKYWNDYFKLCMYIWKTPEFQQKNNIYSEYYRLGSRTPTVSVDTALFDAELKNTSKKYIGVNILLAEEALKLYPVGTDMPLLQTVEEHDTSVSDQPLIVGFFGPVGFGKSTAMVKFCEWANQKYTKKFVAIDGDVMNLTDMEAMNYLKQEKNDYLKYLIAQQIILGNVPVVSHGGHIFSEIGDYIQKITKLVPVLILCQMVLPENMDGYKAVSDDGGGGKKEDTPFSLQTTNEFINSGYTDKQFADKYKHKIRSALEHRLKQTFNNHKKQERITGWLPSSDTFYANPNNRLANEVNSLIPRVFKPSASEFHLSYMGKLNSNKNKYKCMHVNPDTDMNFDNLDDVINSLLGGVHVIDIQNITFTQYRYLVKYWPEGSQEWPNVIPNQVSFGHITLEYNPEGVLINSDVLKKESINRSGEYKYDLVIAKGENREISAIVLAKIESSTDRLFDIEYFDIRDSGKPKFLHITVNSGIHTNVLMGKLAEHVLDKKQEPLILTGVDNKIKSRINVKYTNITSQVYNVVFYTPYYV